MKRGLSLNNPVIRYFGNPILTPNDVNRVWTSPALKVKTVHNAGITKYKNKTIMLFRSHLRSGRSIIGLASSTNGITNWKINSKPFLLPDSKNEQEAGGLEDPRITKINNNYIITYNAYHSKIKDKVRVLLASTKDFKSYKKLGHAFSINMRNMALFPEKINNKFLALVRPNDKSLHALGGKFTEVKLAQSKKMEGPWKITKTIIKTGQGPSAISDKIGPGAPPIKTKKGWLNIFHGVRSTMSANPYVLTVALHNLKNPNKVKVSNIPILFPTEADANIPKTAYRHAGQVVFTCGAIKKQDGEILIYYGGFDTVMNLATTHENILIELCEKYGQDPLSNKPLYKISEK